jgi:type II secretory pathway component GspD/PulD (secretin)
VLEASLSVWDGGFGGTGTVGTATFSVDPDTHKIIVGRQETAAQLQKLIAQLDSAKGLVEIKMVFLEVSQNNASDTGISQIIGQDFPATLQAIAQAGQAEILARPAVLARDGQMAEIVAGHGIYLPIGVVESVSDNGASTSTNYQKAGLPLDDAWLATNHFNLPGTMRNLGLQLDVTPFLQSDHKVKMILALQDTAIDATTPGPVTATGRIQSGHAVYASNLKTTPASPMAVTPDGKILSGNAVYESNLRTASTSTEVVTADGETVVIGGLIQASQPVNESKNLLKTSPKPPAKRELVIFVTPHIVPTAEELAAMSVDERVRAGRQMTNSLTEQALNQFLQPVPVETSRRH